MSYTIIAAIGKNNELGKDNKLMWSLKGDLKFFKEKTTNHTIIMGRKTFESLGRVLPNRHHIILCNDAKMDIQDKNVEILEDISLLENYINDNEEHFVIGGATMYRLLMPKCNKMYITEINQEFDGDVSFPEIDLSKWKVTEREKGLQDEKNPFDYEYVTYEKI